MHGRQTQSDTPPSDELPVRRSLSVRVHDDAAQVEELLGGEVLREEVGEIVVRADERDADAVIFDYFAHVEVAAGDVLGALVMLGVVREIRCRALGAG